MSDFKDLTVSLRELLDDMSQVAEQVAEPDWDVAGDLLRGYQAELWRSKGASGAHGSWRPRKDPSRPGSLMDVTSKLKRSTTVAGHPNQIFLESANTLRFGTSVSYAHYHQNGSGRLPIRRVIDINEDQVDELAEEMADLLFKPVADPDS